jgi:hypothetical protein
MLETLKSCLWANLGGVSVGMSRFWMSRVVLGRAGGQSPWGAERLRKMMQNSSQMNKITPWHS